MSDNRNTKKDFVPVALPFLWGNESAYARTAIEGGWISSRGKFVGQFEQVFAKSLGVKFAAAVSSGTAALHLALDTLNLSSGDEVIVPDFSMISPVLAVLYCGATPVPVDVDDTWNIDPLIIEKKITDKTRAIIAVHTYGHPADMVNICRIAKRHGLYVIEDGAEALGATVNDQPVGSFADISCFSLYANKIITTGEGGVLATSDPQLYERACWKRDMCFGPDNESRFVHNEVGYNYRLTNVQAAIGLAQMEHYEAAIAAKIKIGNDYNNALEGIHGLRLPPEKSWAKNVYWVYGVVVEKGFGVSRAALQELLLEEGIDTRRFFSAVHCQPIVKREQNADYPNSTHLAENGLYLPSFIGMTTETIERVANTIRSINEQYGKL